MWGQSGIVIVKAEHVAQIQLRKRNRIKPLTRTKGMEVNDNEMADEDVDSVSRELISFNFLKAPLQSLRRLWPYTTDKSCPQHIQLQLTWSHNCPNYNLK